MIAAVAQLAAVLGGLWQPVGPGVWQHEARMAESGSLSVVRVIAIRLDPARVRFSLDTATRDLGTRGAWTIDRTPADAVVAFNGGQFDAGRAFGWLVVDGTESAPPGTGSLAMAFTVDSSGTPALRTPDEIDAARGHVRLALQSYPALLVRDSELPWELQAPGRGANLDHRDSRLALGILEDGSVVVALTRFAGLGDGAETLPWGPTVPEMAEYMRALGCRRAMMLDGGISSQMALRQTDGSLTRWTNWRAVPLGILVRPRPPAPSGSRIPPG